MLNRICIFLVGTFFLSYCDAQIVAIDNARLQKLKEGWSGDLALNFALTSNTRQIIQLGNKNKVYFKKDLKLVTCITDFSFVSIDNENFVNNGFSHIRFANQSKQFSRIHLEGFMQAQYNQIQLIKQRYLIGAGSRATVIDRDSTSVNVGAFLMGEYEQERSDKINKHIRYSCFLSFDFQFSKTTGFNSITYYQPDFFYPGDYRISSETSLRFNITQKLKFKLIYSIQHDTQPPVDAPKTIYSIQNAFGFSF